MKGTDNFSFSGLKTAVYNKVKKYKNDKNFSSYIPILANSLQETVVDVLFTKTINVALREKVFWNSTRWRSSSQLAIKGINF